MNVAVIPVRGGSKRLPKKNLRKINGKSLLQIAIEDAIKSKCFEDVYVLTDDLNMVSEAESAGAIVPYLRDSDASDLSPIEDVISNFISKIKLNEDDYITLLQATSPLRRDYHIERALNKLYKSSAVCLVSVTELNHKAYPNMLMKGDQNCMFFVPPSMKEQSFKDNKLYVRDGPMILVNTVKNWKMKNKFVYPLVGYRTCSLCSIDIDTYEDYLLAKTIVESGVKHCACEK